MKILWLASWYPSKNDMLTGDFFQRHAKAASLYFTIDVLHIKRDDAIAIPIDKNIYQENNLTETIILYKPFIQFIKGLDTFISAVTWFSLMKKEINNYILENGKPNCIHVQAAWKCGLMALWCKTKYNIPYLISEQYTGYFTEAKGLVPTFNKMQHFFLRKIFANAKMVLPVSDYLGKALQKKYNISYKVLDNVIDTSIFKPSAIQHGNTIFTLLHVSLLNLQKNPDIIFKACEILIQKNFSFQLQLVAPEEIAEKYLQKYPSIKPYILLLPETKQTALASIMQKADILLFPSAFESFGLVAYEAIACGTPVIVSDIEVFTNKLLNKPYIHFCKVNNAESLAEAIVKSKNKSINFPKNEMYKFIDLSFSTKIIGEKMKEIYKLI